MSDASFGLTSAFQTFESEVNRVTKGWKAMFGLMNEICVRSDADLVGLAREGSQEAFGELIKRHHNACVKLAASRYKRRVVKHFCTWISIKGKPSF
jgi:hypothetical protein